MKKQLQFLTFILMVAFVQSCAPVDPVTPDTGDVRDKYKGTWLFIENPVKSGLNSSFMVVISLNSSNSSQVLISNFGNPGSGSNAVNGIVTSSGIVVTSQSSAPDFVVEGSGTLTNASVMDWTYSIKAGADMTTYHAIATKQ